MADGVDEKQWIGVDLDGTLARDYGWNGKTHIGNPIPRMAARIRRWHNAGKRVKIFTARADDPTTIPIIKRWLKKHKLPDLEVTNEKFMSQLWDDKAVAMTKNQGTRKDDERIAETVVETLLEGDDWREFQDWVPYWVSPNGNITSAMPSHVVWAANNVLKVSPQEGQIVQRMERLGWLKMSVKDQKVFIDSYKARNIQLREVRDWAIENRKLVYDDKTQQPVSD
jgi:hypothetical protein